MSKRRAEIEDDVRNTSAKTFSDDTPVKPDNDDEDMGEFEDPYEDEFESDEEIVEIGGDSDEDEEMDEDIEANGQEKALQTIREDQEMEVPKPAKKDTPSQKIYLPHRSAPLGPNEIMEPDPTTYDMLHTINVDWPCLSFDILEDNLGNQRRGYPQTTYIVAGTQAKRPRDNEISVIKLSSLSKTLVKDDEEDDGESDDNDEELDPVLEKKSLPTLHTTNRVRVSPFAQKTGEYLTTSMSESGDVYIWDVSPHFRSFDTPGTVIFKQMNRPVHTIHNHGNVEGYAVDWSPLNSKKASILTGDVSGRIYLTVRTEAGWSTDKTAFTTGKEGKNNSVEEIQWSKSEECVFASGGSDGFIRIWDTRSKKHQPSLSIKASNTDINVMTWNPKASNLLASGDDNGKWGVWDLRSFVSAAKSSEVPDFVASFDFHKKPITSIEFHPDEESVIAVASEDSTVTLWDLSVEADDEEIKTQRQQDTSGELDDVPSQLLFLHWQRDAKEVHWHRQIPGALVSTGSDGFSIWKTISV